MERQVETGMMNREETEREGRPEEDSRLWQMAGIDTAAGLEYAGEDGALYREILAEYISCIEEIAYKRGFISKEQLVELAQPLLKTAYGQYLIEVSKGL